MNSSISWIVMSSDLSLPQRIGRRIAQARRQARLTQAEVAERLGWTRDSYAHYEYGRRSPQLDRLAAIAATLGVPLAALVTDNDDLAALIMRIAARPDLAGHVSFFLDTLDDAPPAPPPTSTPF